MMTEYQLTDELFDEWIILVFEINKDIHRTAGNVD